MLSYSPAKIGEKPTSITIDKYTLKDAGVIARDASDAAASFERALGCTSTKCIVRLHINIDTRDIGGLIRRARYHKYSINETKFMKYECALYGNW